MAWSPSTTFLFLVVGGGWYRLVLGFQRRWIDQTKGEIGDLLIFVYALIASDVNTNA